MHERIVCALLCYLIVLVCMFHGTISIGAEEQPLEKKSLKVGVSLFRPWVMCAKTQENEGERAVREGSNRENLPLTMCEQQIDCALQVGCELVGFDVDVATRLAEDRQEGRPEFVEVKWKEIIPDLDAGEYALVAGMAVTAERARNVWFSNPYATSGINLAANIRETKDMQSLDDLKKEGFKTAVVAGTLSAKFVWSASDEVFNSRNIVEYDTSHEAEEALRTGAAAVYVESIPLPRILAEDNPDTVDVPVLSPLVEYKTSFAVKKGNHDLLHYLNAWIVARESDGWLQRTREYWFEDLRWFRPHETASE